MNNIKEIVEATPAQLSTVPISFGKHAGTYIFDLPNEYLKWLTDISGEDIHKKSSQARNYINDLNTSDLYDTNKTIEYPKGFWDWQKAAFSFFYNKYFGGILAAAGSGKSRVMVEIMKAQGIESALIICPLAVFSSWANQFRLWSGLRVAYTEDPKLKRDIIQDPAKIHILNFHSLLNKDVLDDILNKKYEWIIIDESHNIKNPKKFTSQGSKRFSIGGAALKLGGSAKKRFILTGTPKEKTLLDLYNQISFLDHGKAFGTNFYKFRANYFIKGYDGWTWEANPILVPKIKKVIQDYCIVVKKEDLKNMPPLIEKNHDIPMGKEQCEKYDELKKKAEIILKLDKNKFITIQALFKIVEVLRLHQICGGTIKTEEGPFVFKDNPKLDYLFQCIKSPETETPPLIFSQYKIEHDRILKRSIKEKMKFGIIAGGRSDRTETIDKFIKGKLDALIVQPAAGGVGIDGFQKISRDIFYYSQGYSRTLKVQAVARLQRGGALGSIVLNNLLSSFEGKSTVDHLILDAIDKKDKDFREFFYE